MAAPRSLGRLFVLYKIARYYDYHSTQRNDVHQGQRSSPRLRKKRTQNLVQLFVNSPSWGARSQAKWSLKLLGGRARRPVPLSHVHPTRARGLGRLSQHPRQGLLLYHWPHPSTAGGRPTLLSRHSLEEFPAPSCQEPVSFFPSFSFFSLFSFFFLSFLLPPK